MRLGYAILSRYHLFNPVTVAFDDRVPHISDLVPDIDHSIQWASLAYDIAKVGSEPAQQLAVATARFGDLDLQLVRAMVVGDNPRWCAFVVGRGTLYIVVRGSDEGKDWRVNFDAKPKVVKLGGAVRPSFV